MLWVWLTLTCAFTLAASDTMVKAALNRGAPVHMAAWLRVLLSLPLLVPALFLMEGPLPPFGRGAVIALLAGMPLEVLALYMHTRALKVSPMSLTVPFLAFTPVFVILTGWVWLGERVSAAGALGIALVVTGGYVLNLDRARHGLLEPIRAIAREPGSILMLMVSAIYSLTATFIKVGVVNSSAVYYGVVYFVVLSVAYAPFALMRRGGGSGVGVFPRGGVLWLLVGAGALEAVMLLTHVLAVSLVEVAYMVAVKRTSLLFGVGMGFLFFGEGRMRQRGAGAALMFAGFVCIAFIAA